MTLVYLALGARILLLGVHHILIKKLTEYGTIALIFWWYAFSVVIYAPFALSRGTQDFSFLPYTLGATAVYAVAIVLFTQSLREGEASLVTPLKSITGLFALFLAVVFLGEQFTFMKLFGILLIVSGASFLTRGKDIVQSYKALFSNRAAVYMMLSVAFMAAGRVFDGAAVRITEPIMHAFFVEVFGMILFGSYLLCRGQLASTTVVFRKRPVMMTVFLIESTTSYFCLLYVFSHMEVSVAEPLTMLSLLITVVIAKYVFKERIKERLLGAVIMIGGAWLLIV